MIDYSRCTDTELTDALTAGDQFAYTEIYNRYWAILYQHAFTMLSDGDAARDVVQDIFTDLWMRASTIQITSSLKAYLYTMARFKVIDIIRRDVRQERHLQSWMRFSERSVEAPDEQVVFNEFMERLDAEVSRLPKRMQEIFKMSRFEGKTNKEIAEETGISHESVKKTIHRVLVKLKSKLLILFFM